MIPAMTYDDTNGDRMRWDETLRQWVPITGSLSPAELADEINPILSSRYEPLSEVIVIPATMFNVTSGTAAVSTMFSVDAVRTFADGSANYVGLNVGRLPTHWDTYSLSLRWCNMLTGTGNVVWTAFVGATGVGDTIGTFTSIGGSTAAAGGQFVVVETTAAGWTDLAAPASGDDLVVTIARAGADGADTLAASAGLYAVVIAKGN